MDAILLEEIIYTLSEHLNVSVDEITVDSLITDDLRADSLDIVELVDIFETKYGITATDEDIMGFSTVESVYDFIAEKLGVKANGNVIDERQITW
jgi:acyl carrier protein